MDESAVEAKKLSPTLTPKPSEAELKPSPPPSAPVVAMPTPPGEPISTPQPKVSKKLTSIVLVCLLIVAGFLIFASTVRCMPIVKSYTVDEKYKQSDWIPAKEVIFQDTVYLDAASTYGSGWRKESKRFWLEKHCEIVIDADYSNTYGWATLYDFYDTSIGTKGTYVTPTSGYYHVTFSNFGSSTGCTVSFKITVTAKLQTVEKTVTITKYEVAYLTIIEWLTKKS